MNYNGPFLTIAVLAKSQEIISCELTRTLNLEILEKMVETGLIGVKLIYNKLLESVRANATQKNEQIFKI
ncbi:hypothetical protein MHBO_003580 [Bonamia ostreae]|uniref:Uncharacterized protein n=1 Tax=Bonamia ostreae TaxID=126728 RepID=A0ABV2AR02_9EUKA